MPREIVVNLINGKWHAAYSNYEHEMIGEKAGLPPEKVQALIAGLPTSFEDPRQQVAYEMTCALIEPRVVPTRLYRRAVKLFPLKALIFEQLTVTPRATWDRKCGKGRWRNR
jgi:hypothetical protein